MKPGRNEPCPCGSGKKYKKCCYFKEQGDDGSEAQDLRDDSEEERVGQESWADIASGFRRLLLNMKPHIKEYYKIRKLHSDVVDAMVKYHDDGKFEKAADPNYVHQNTQLGKRNNTIHVMESCFDFETREGAQAFYDMQIYKTARNMNCITEDFIEKHRYRRPEKIEFLHSMLDSRLGLFEITGTEMFEGYVDVEEVLTGDKYRLVDVGLSGSGNCVDFYLYTRIITYHGISFNSGLNLPFNKTDPFIKKHIEDYKKDYSPDLEFVRFTQLYNQFSKYPDKVKFTTSMPTKRGY